MIQGGAIRHDTCRHCGCPILRTQATRIWFLAGMMARGDGTDQPPNPPPSR